MPSKRAASGKYGKPRPPPRTWRRPRRRRVHDAVEPDRRVLDSIDGAGGAVVVGDLAPDHGPIGPPVHVAGEVEAEVCVAVVDADGASGKGLTDVPPPSALQAPSTSSAARAIPAAPTRRAMRRRGDAFTIGSCMFIPRWSVPDASVREGGSAFKEAAQKVRPTPVPQMSPGLVVFLRHSTWMLPPSM